MRNFSDEGQDLFDMHDSIRALMFAQEFGEKIRPQKNWVLKQKGTLKSRGRENFGSVEKISVLRKWALSKYDCQK